MRKTEAPVAAPAAAPEVGRFDRLRAEAQARDTAKAEAPKAEPYADLKAQLEAEKARADRLHIVEAGLRQEISHLEQRIQQEKAKP